MRRSTAAALALTCLGTSVGSTALTATSVSAEPAAVSKPSAAKKYARQAHNATNNRREEHGLRALRQTDCIQRFAVKQAKAMAAKEEMYHQDLGPILQKCGLDRVGENVAYGYPTGRSVVNVGWMNSPGHRANILNPGYRLMGLAARQSDDGTWYAAQVFGRKA